MTFSTPRIHKISTHLQAIGLSLLLTACASVPPAPPAPREAAVVTAPFTKTWDAAIDVFAQQNISIRTIDKASGLIVAEPMHTTRSDSSFADCGTIMGLPIPVTGAIWNLLVRGDSTKSTVRATVRFTSGTGGDASDCSSRGLWETQLEQRIKASAEAKK